METSSYGRMLGIICSVFDAYTAVLFLKDDADGKRCSLASVFSLGDKINRDAVIEEGQGVVGWILRNQTPLLVPNFDQRRNHLGYYNDNEEQSIKAFMGCALPGGRGIICVDSKRQYSFSEKDQKMLYLFAELLAALYDLHCALASRDVALRFYNALKVIYVLRRQHSRWSEFLELFLQTVSQASGYEYCALCTKTEDGEHYRVEGESALLLVKPGQELEYHMSSGLVGWVFRNAEPLVSGGGDGSSETPLLGRVGDTPAFQSVMALPLLVQRKVRGVLCFASSNAHASSDGIVEFARMASEHLSLYLENLYVKCRLRDVYGRANASAISPE